jgi:hypothetical protein
MGDYEQSRDVNAPAQALFDYLADVRNMPSYFSSMTSAEPAEGEAVHVTAVVDGKEREGEAWFKIDRDHMHLTGAPKARTTTTAASTSSVTTPPAECRSRCTPITSRTSASIKV